MKKTVRCPRENGKAYEAVPISIALELAFLIILASILSPRMKRWIMKPTFDSVWIVILPPAGRNMFMYVTLCPKKDGPRTIPAYM